MTREEAIQVLKDISWQMGSVKRWDNIEAIDMAIEALSADAEQGEWIDVENEPYCECSVCGAYIDNLDDDYAFCPRCGARMKCGAELSDNSLVIDITESSNDVVESQDDVIEVVRCKECTRNNDGNLCDIAFYINDDGDGFCNCGERREP